MEMSNLKNIVKGSATLDCILSGGIAVYKLLSEDGHVYQIEINMADKHDVGESASFQPYYEKAIILMRWIRRAIENDTIIEL